MEMSFESVRLEKREQPTTCSRGLVTRTGKIDGGGRSVSAGSTATAPVW